MPTMYLHVCITMFHFTAAEAKIAIFDISYAVFYLQVAEEIVDHLGKGRDIVANVEKKEKGVGMYGQEVEVFNSFCIFDFYCCFSIKQS